MDKFMQIDFVLPTQMIYGFGERTRNFGLSAGSWTMWSKGWNMGEYDDGFGFKQGPGTHPFALIKKSQKVTDTEYFGMFFRNSAPQSPILTFDEVSGCSTLSYITLGGDIDIHYFFFGTPK